MATIVPHLSRNGKSHADHEIPDENEHLGPCFVMARTRAVQLVFEHRDKYESEWAAITSIAGKFGCSTETLRSWVRKEERDSGMRPGVTTGQQDELKELRREVRELRRANEILRKASACLAQAELDRRPRR